MFGRNKGPSQEEIVEARREEEAEKNHEIARINAHTLTLLMPTLRGNPALDFDKLKAPFTPEPLSLGELAVPNQSPIRPPHDPKWEKQAQKIAKKTGSLPPRSPAQIAYDIEDQAFTLKERERSAAIEEAEYQNRLRNEAIRVQVAAQHKQVEAFAHDYHQQNPSAIQHYFTLLFQQHTLPDPFNKTVTVCTTRRPSFSK